MRRSMSVRTIVVKTMALMMTVNLVTLGFVQSANAGVIGTEAAMLSQERAERIERIHSVLSRDSVQEQLERLGVDPDAAKARVASLSDAELVALDERMHELPAGAGALEVLGIVLLVLLVLEIVGVTDIFKAV